MGINAVLLGRFLMELVVFLLYPTMPTAAEHMKSSSSLAS